MKSLVFTVCICFLSGAIAAQTNVPDSTGQEIAEPQRDKSGRLATPSAGQTARFRTHISFEWGMQLPQGDMSDRFGNNFNIGSQVELLQMKNLWHVGIKGYFIFGNQVKQDVLSNLRTPEGFIIGNDRAPATVFLRERGYFMGVYGGKIFRMSNVHKQSGIKVSVGGGLLQHKVRIQDDTKTVTQLTGDYKKGYDRLSNGPALYGFLGYQHLAVNKRFNFLAGLDITWASTKNRRSYNFDEGRKDESSYSDLLIGFRVGFILPITTGETASSIYY